MQLLQGARVGSEHHLSLAASGGTIGVWALSLSACGGLLAAVSWEGRLEARSQQCTTLWAATPLYQMLPRGLVQLHAVAAQAQQQQQQQQQQPAAAAADAPDGAAAATAEEMRVLLGAAAEAAPPAIPEGQPPPSPRLALRTVAFNPNPAHRRWVACAGPSGLLACVRVPAS